MQTVDPKIFAEALLTQEVQDVVLRVCAQIEKSRREMPPDVRMADFIDSEEEYNDSDTGLSEEWKELSDLEKKKRLDRELEEYMTQPIREERVQKLVKKVNCSYFRHRAYLDFCKRVMPHLVNPSDAVLQVLAIWYTEKYDVASPVGCNFSQFREHNERLIKDLQKTFGIKVENNLDVMMMFGLIFV